MAMTTIEALTKKMAEVKAEIRDHGATALKAEFKTFFEAHPTCKAIRWKQYTPYFNDGDACTFRVTDPTVRMDDTPEDAGDYEDGFEETYCYGEEPQRPVFAAAAKACKVLSGIDDEIYRIAFDEHVQVTATREGFEVEEYEHE